MTLPPTGPDRDPTPPTACSPSRGACSTTPGSSPGGGSHMKRQPEALSDATIQPIMFVLLFGFVFGGAIGVPGGELPGVPDGRDLRPDHRVQHVRRGHGIANDRKNQAVDRFRSLPIANGAVLGGHAVANLLKTVLPIVIMSLCGLVVGWRINGSLVEALAGYVLMLAFSFAMIWVGVLLGSLVGTPEGVTGIGFAVLFP